MKKKPRMKAKKGDWQPTREFIQKAVKDYLKRGGEVKKIEATVETYSEFMEENIFRGGQI